MSVMSTYLSTVAGDPVGDVELPAYPAFGADRPPLPARGEGDQDPSSDRPSGPSDTPPAAAAAQVARAAAMAGLLSDVTRLRLLLTLTHGERCVGELTTRLGLQQPTVSHHLALLRGEGLVNARRAGKQIFYSLGDRVGWDGKVLQVRGGGFQFRIPAGPGEATADRGASADPLRPPPGGATALPD